MSLYAKTKSGEYVTANSMLWGNDVSIDDCFYCPSCGCEMYYKSASSNGRVEHFAGKHSIYCDIGLTNDSGTNSLRFKHSNIKSFFDFIINDKIKRTNAKVSDLTDNKKNTIVNNKRLFKTIRTIRQLFVFFANSSPDSIVCEKTYVKDVYCGLNTRYLYTKYINGIHLVFAEYNWNNKENTLYFNYPLKVNAQIKIIVEINDKFLFSTMCKLLKKHYEKPVLIFGDFDNNKCLIESETQIVPLRRKFKD